MPQLIKTFNAILFDLDGTLIDSTPAVVSHWQRFGHTHSIPPETILATSHGRRTIDVVRQYKPELATPEYVNELEARIPREAEQAMKEGRPGGAVLLPGAKELIEGLVRVGGKWAIVTSGTWVLAGAWVRIMNLPTPPCFITADLVANGKPDPEGYIAARKSLAVPANPGSPFTSPRVLVVEDAPAGVRAGKAAGCEVVGLLTTHTREQLVEAGADYIVEDLGSVELVEEESQDAGKEDGMLVLRIRLAFERAVGEQTLLN